MKFNPIKEQIDGKLAHDVIWSSDIINKAIDGLNAGKKLVANPFYENNTKLLKGDLVFERTQEEIDEWNHCADDIIYFANTYCKLMTPQGIKNVTMRDYQEEYLQHLVKNRLSIFISCRQSAKTTTSAIFMLHYILFNFDKNALVLGNKRRTACEIMDKIKKIFYELPYFLKPGVYKWNEAEIAFDNGCRILAEATTINSGISFTFHCVLADEFAHIQPNILDKFYNNLFPTITAGKARFIISSTQNGFNLFYRLYKAAEAGENDYAPFKVDWWQVPEWNPEKQCWEKRDEEWHRRQVANYGSEEAFNKQFGTDFDVTTGTLINPKIIKKFRTNELQYKSLDIPGLPLSQFYYWNPNIDVFSELRNSFFIITVDISEGGGGDYTVFCFNKMILNSSNEIEYETIGYFRSNSNDIKVCVNSLYTLCANFMDMNKYTISVELNMYGDLFVYNFKDEILSHPQLMSIINEDVLCKYYNDNQTRFTNGIKMTHASKSHACMMFKNDYEHCKIRNYDVEFLRELVNFCDSTGNGSFKASYGHDDFVMAQVQLELAKSTLSVRALIDLIGANVDNNNDNYDIYGGAPAMPSGMYGAPAMPSGMYGNTGQMFGDGFDMYGGSSIDPTLSRLSRF